MSNKHFNAFFILVTTLSFLIIETAQWNIALISSPPLKQKRLRCLNYILASVSRSAFRLCFSVMSQPIILPFWIWKAIDPYFSDIKKFKKSSLYFSGISSSNEGFFKRSMRTHLPPQKVVHYLNTIFILCIHNNTNLGILCQDNFS